MHNVKKRHTTITSGSVAATTQCTLQLCNGIQILCPKVGYTETKIDIIQGYSKRNIHFQKFILQVLLTIFWCAIYRLKVELSKLFSHLTSTQCEPHVWRGNVRSIIHLFPHSSQHVTGNNNHSLSDVPLQNHRYQNFEIFPFHPYTGHGLNVSTFCKINFWKWILLLE
jgi:hypothetical protein